MPLFEFLTRHRITLREAVFLLALLVPIIGTFYTTMERVSQIQDRLTRIEGQLQWFIGEVVRDNRGWQPPPENWVVPDAHH